MFSFSKSPNGGQEMYWGGWNGWFWPVAKLKNLNSRKRGGDYIRSKLEYHPHGLAGGGGCCNDFQIVSCICKMYFVLVFFGQQEAGFCKLH